jgi:hypothetical protein
MGLFDKLRERFAQPAHTAHPTHDHHQTHDHHRAHDHHRPQYGHDQGRDPDEVAVERYRYMLKTAPPETIEQAHAEAFAKLTPEQRSRVLAEMSTNVPEAERARSTDPREMARMATRAEMHNPGTMERTLGGGRQGPGMGSMIAGTLLASVAGAFIGTAIADAFFDDDEDDMSGGEEDLAGGEEFADTGAEDFGGEEF